MIMPWDSIIGTAEVSEILGLSEQRVWQLAMDKKFQYKNIGRTMIFDKTEIIVYKRAREIVKGL